MAEIFDLMADIDDVLFPWADEIHRRARERGLHDLETYTSWHMWEDYGCTKEVWLDVVADAALDGLYVNTPPMSGAVEALRRLAWEGHRIHLVTARGFRLDDPDELDQEIRSWTFDWVAEFAVPHATLTFARDKVKAQADLGVRFDAAIDDGVHNFNALYADGVNVSLLTRPHNEAAVVPTSNRVSSVGVWADSILERAR